MKRRQSGEDSEELEIVYSTNIAYWNKDVAYDTMNES